MAVVLTDIQIAFAAGALFADAGAPVIEAARRESESKLAKIYSSYMLRSLIYAGVFLGPVATISLLAYPVAGFFQSADQQDEKDIQRENTKVPEPRLCQ